MTLMQGETCRDFGFFFLRKDRVATWHYYAGLLRIDYLIKTLLGKGAVHFQRVINIKTYLYEAINTLLFELFTSLGITCRVTGKLNKPCSHQVGILSDLLF